MGLTYRSNLDRPLNTTEIDDNFRHFTGSHAVTGSLTASEGFVGNLTGTASFATTASYIILAQTASFVELAQTASFVELAQTASFVELAQTASYVLNAISSSYSVSSSISDNALNATTASYVDLAQTASFVTIAQTASFVELAQTASFVELIQGPGVLINGLEISSSLITVNGQYPVNGNIGISLTSTITGTSASLVASSSGDITASLSQGTLWIISGDSTPAENGKSFIYVSESTQWTLVPSSDQAINDGRYLKLAGDNGPIQGNLDMGGFSITNALNFTGTASLATTASYVALAQTASFVTGSSVVGDVAGATFALSSSYALSGSYTLTSSYADTASYIETSQTASFVTASNVHGTVANAEVAVTASVASGVFTLQPQDPLPSVVNGGLVVSSSGYIYYGLNGAWNVIDFD